MARQPITKPGQATLGNVVGIDPHKHTLSAAVIDGCGGLLGVRHFKVSSQGHRALEAWAGTFGPVLRWGVEGAGACGRHSAIFLARRGHDVREVCPNRTKVRGRSRGRGKSDALDAELIARETLAHPELPAAFKRAAGDSGPEEVHELMGLWHRARCMRVKQAQLVLGEAESLLVALPEDLRDQLPATKSVPVRLAALARIDRKGDWDEATRLRVRLLADCADSLAQLQARELEAGEELMRLVRQTGSTLPQLIGLSYRSVAELLVEVGDVRRFTEGGFARFNGTAPIPASSGEGGRPPVRHRYNPGGNRDINSVLHRMAITQLRHEPRARKIYDDARARGHTKREARRILKRHLSDVVYRRMRRDLEQAVEPAA